MRSALLATVMACGLATGARAGVWNLTGQAYNAEAQSRNAIVSFELVISDAAVARGSFNLTETATTQLQTISGDVADFVSASTGPSRTGGQVITPTLAYYANVNISLAFVGGVASGNINFFGESDAIALTGTSGTFSGNFGSDLNGCEIGGPSFCTVTGQLAASATTNPVPEPASMGLLGAGLAALIVRRRVRM